MGPASRALFNALGFQFLATIGTSTVDGLRRPDQKKHHAYNGSDREEKQADNADALNQAPHASEIGFRLDLGPLLGFTLAGAPQWGQLSAWSLIS